MDDPQFDMSFFLACAVSGVSGDELPEVIKAASLNKTAFWGKLLTTAALAPIAVGGIAGAAGGYGLGSLVGNTYDVNQPDSALEHNAVKDLKKQELIETYRMYAEQARRNALRRKQPLPSKLTAFVGNP